MSYLEAIEAIKTNFFEHEGNSTADYKTEDDFDAALTANAEYWLDNSWQQILSEEPDAETKREIVRCVLESTSY